MRRATVQFLAVAVLVLLGAPVALHIIVHDLRHADNHQHADVYATDDVHGDHGHPVVSSSVPQFRAATRIVTTDVVNVVISLTWIRAASLGRNAIAHGAVRLDDDVGLQPLLSTFLI